MTTDENVKAHQAIGAYFCAFSALERELGEAIKVVFRLQGHEAADAIAAALEMAKKIDLVWTAVLLAKKADGTETTEEWKEKAAATMSEIYGSNSQRNARSALISNQPPMVRWHLPVCRIGVAYLRAKVNQINGSQHTSQARSPN